MKQILCKYEGCLKGGKHWCNPYGKRYRNKITLADDDSRATLYCSIECACYDGAYSIKKGWKLSDGRYEGDLTKEELETYYKGPKK